MKPSLGTLSAIALCATLPGALSIPSVKAQTATAQSNASAQLKSVIGEHWKWWLSVHPLDATALGVRDYDDRLPDYSLEEADRESAREQQFLDRLNAISDDGLSEEDKVNKAVLAWMLSSDITANGFGERMMLFSTYYSWPQSFADMANGQIGRAHV